jgi:hypothetical protein
MILENKFHLAGIKEFLLRRSKSGDLLVTSGSARALYGPAPEGGRRKVETSSISSSR